MAVTAETLITDALNETGIVDIAETPSDEYLAKGLRLLNRGIMSPWNVIDAFAMTRLITSGTFAADAVTVTIGPTGTYVIAVRPDEILQAHSVDSNGRRTVIAVRDEGWYAALDEPARTAASISDIAYFQTVLNGTMYPWPIPTADVTVELETRSVLLEFADLDTSADFAPGYEQAITETLKELCCATWGAPVPFDLPDRARRARDIVMSPHMKARRISTIPY